MKYLKLYESFNKITMSVRKETIHFFSNDIEIGYVEYYYSDSISIGIDRDEKEFYLAYIEVYPEFKGNDYASKILTLIKEYAASLGATIITLRIEYGMGYGLRNPNNYLDRLYLKNGFKYSFTEEECALNDEKNLGAMEYRIREIN